MSTARWTGNSRAAELISRSLLFTEALPIRRFPSPGWTTAVILLFVYMLTLAPGVTLWDSGEFLAAIHSFGIPHPPGTPLYILIGKIWSMLFASVFGFARSINLLSAVCTAFGCGILTSMFAKWTGDGFAATAAGLTAGLMSTVWLSATETEVYAVALLFGCMTLWAADRAGEDCDARWALLAAYLSGLGWSLHLMALLVVPSAILLVFTTDDGYFAVPVGRRYADGRREAHSFAKLLRAAVVVTVLGMTCVLFLLIRARHDPAINQGNPSTLGSLVDVILRRQYDVPHLWPRQAPFYLQLGNVFEYADWQFAKGLASNAPPNLWRTSVTILYALVGLYGFFGDLGGVGDGRSGFRLEIVDGWGWNICGLGARDRCVDREVRGCAAGRIGLRKRRTPGHREEGRRDGHQDAVESSTAIAIVTHRHTPWVKLPRHGTALKSCPSQLLLDAPA